MTKAKFIGESDSFFRSGEIYDIRRSRIDWLGPARVIKVTFRPSKQECPLCHRRISILDHIFAERAVSYKNLESFLKNWEVIYE